MTKKEARRQSRIAAVEIFFNYLQREKKVSLEECFDFVVTDIEERKGDEFAWKVIHLAAENFGKMKLVLKTFAPEFPFEKIAPINRVILILGLTEMKFIGTPPIVVINEYVELAKSFGEHKSAGFVNAVLDSFRKSLGLSSEKVKEEESV